MILKVFKRALMGIVRAPVFAGALLLFAVTLSVVGAYILARRMLARARRSDVKGMTISGF